MPHADTKELTTADPVRQGTPGPAGAAPGPQPGPRAWARRLLRRGVPGWGALLIVLPGIGPRETPGAAPEALSSGKILQIVQHAPGLPIGEIIHRSGLGAGTVYYHLHRLEEKGVIKTAAAGRRRLVFPAVLAENRDRDALALSILRGRTCYAVAAAIRNRPNVSILDIILQLRQSPRAVYYHVKRLREAGLLKSSSATRYRNLSPGPDLSRLLEQVEAGGTLENDAGEPSPFPARRRASAAPGASPVLPASAPRLDVHALESTLRHWPPAEPAERPSDPGEEAFLPPPAPGAGAPPTLGLDAAHFACLKVLALQPLSVRRIAELAALPRPRATSTLADLCAYGLVRVAGNQSGSSRIHALTAEGRALLHALTEFEGRAQEILKRVTISPP